MNSNNPWRHVRVDAEGLEDNPYLNPRTPAQAAPSTGATVSATPPATPVTVTNSGDVMLLHNLSCVDVAGKVFEQYNTLAVNKDIFRDRGAAQHNFTPYQAAVYSEGKGLFLPSMALSCNIVAALFQRAVKLENGNYTTLDQNAKKVLDQYKDHGSGYGWQAQNTVIDYNGQNIIHYPGDTDFPNHGGTNNINASHPKVELPFKKKTGLFPFTNKKLENMTLEEGLNHPLVSTFVKQFTGFGYPSILVEVGKYFQKPAKVWFPTSPIKVEDCTETRAAWLGCYDFYFYLYGSLILSSDGAARGVRGERQRAGAQKSQASAAKKKSSKNGRKK